MLMMEWGKNRAQQKETYNRKQKEWKSKFTGDESGSSEEKNPTTFQNFNNGYFLSSQLEKKDF